MPFKSERQRRYMYARLPEIARRWAVEEAEARKKRKKKKKGGPKKPRPPKN